MKNAALLLVFCAFLNKGFAQSFSVTTNIADTTGEALAYATVALLNPTDSTLQYYGISNDLGKVEIKQVNSGNYLLQVAYLGYQTYFKRIAVNSLESANLPFVLLRPRTNNLQEVEISAERIPFLIRNDTIEYNAAAFKTKPDANVEALLKKLPGVEVDRAGNIKAQGKSINKVLVDGKEFFGNDAKIATRNLPADAIKNVQVFDKKSDMAEFSGIDDGSRSKTINLTLKDDKKNGYFGDVQAGAGTDDRFQGSAKAYRFQEKQQFAALGMLNNINQFGFTFQDYLGFKGGIGALGSGQIELNSASTLPVNFGQQVTGLVKSGAGGLNYTYEPRKNHRFNVSYLGNGTQKKLNEDTYTNNYAPNFNLISNDSSLNANNDYAHRFNLNYRNHIDSNQRIIGAGGIELAKAKESSLSSTSNQQNGSIQSVIQRNSLSTNYNLNGNGQLSYLKNLSKGLDLFRVAVEANAFTNLNKNQVLNQVLTFNPENELFRSNYNQQDENGIAGNLQTAVLKSLGKAYYLEPKLTLGVDNATLLFKQGESNTDVAAQLNTIKKDYQFTQAELNLKRSTKTAQWNVSLAAELGSLNAQADSLTVTQKVFYLLPKLSWRKELTNGRQLSFNYTSSVNTPQIGQLNPIVNQSNSFSLFSGTLSLKPEYAHRVNLNYNLFDQFSFTSLFVHVNGSYTKDKINYQRTINEQGFQQITLYNALNDYRTSIGADFSTPIRKIGLNINLGIDARWNRGLSLVNSETNVNTNWNNEFSLSFSKRKKEKLDLEFGTSISLNSAKYSLQNSINNKYINTSYFLDLNYRLSDRFNISASADVNNYLSKSFNSAVVIPLLKADVSYFFLKANRGTLTLSAFDLLNKNTGLSRISEMNYLQEKRSNIIGRYLMLSFKYRLSKLGEGNSGLKIQVKNR